MMKTKLTPTERIEQISARLHSKGKLRCEKRCVTCTRIIVTGPEFSECVRCGHNRRLRLVRDGYRMGAKYNVKVPLHRLRGVGKPFPYAVTVQTLKTNEGERIAVDGIPIGTVLEFKKA